MQNFAERFAQYDLQLGEANAALLAAGARIEVLEAECSENLHVIGQLQLELGECRRKYSELVSSRGQFA